MRHLVLVLLCALASLCSGATNLTCTTQSLQSGVFLLGPCPSNTPISVTINAAGVELSIIDSTISTIVSTDAVNLWISLTRVAVNGLLPVVSNSISNYTLIVQQCTISITSPVDLLYLTRATAAAPAVNFSFSMRASTVFLTATSAATPALGLVQFAATLSNSTITVEDSTITTSWSGTTSTAQVGTQADVNLVWMSAGGSTNIIKFSNVNATLTGSGNNIVVLANNQILASTRVELVQVNSTVTAVGPRKAVALDKDNKFNAVSREASLVVVESGGASIMISLSKCTLAATVKQSPLQIASATSQTSLIDILMAFLVRFISRDGAVTVDASSMIITIPPSGGLAGIFSVVASGAVASLTINFGGGVSGVTLQNVAIRVTSVAVSISIADRALCGYPRTLSVEGKPLATSNAGAALLFAVVSVGLDSSNISISVNSSTLAYTPPNFGLCPNVATSSVTYFLTFYFPLPSYNTTVMATVLLGSPADLLITMVRTMFTGLDAAFPAFNILSSIQPTAPTVTSTSAVQVINSLVYTDTSNAPIFGTSLSSSWYAAVVTALKIHYSTPLSLDIDYPSTLMIVPALLMQTVELGYATGTTVVRVDQRTAALATANAFVPSVVLLDNITDVTFSQVKRLSVAISRLSSTLSVANGYVFARDVKAAVDWNFYSLRWSTAFVNRTFSGSNLSVASAPLMVVASTTTTRIAWPVQSSIALRCVYCNGLELRQGAPTIFGTNASAYVAPPSAVRYRQCELTRTIKYVTTTRRHLDTASMGLTLTKTLTLPPLQTPTREPTPTIDPNFTDITVGLSIENFESAIVTIAYAAPLLTAAATLQRSFGVLRVATRCATIDRLHRVRTTDGDPLLYSAAENPLQLKLGSGFIDELHLDYAAGGVVGNAIFVVICAMFTVVMLFLWNCVCGLLGEEGLTVKTTDVLAAGTLASYGSLLQPSITGAVGAIALVPSSIPKSCCSTGNIVLGVGGCLLWLLPTAAVCHAFLQWDDEDAFDHETLRIVGEHVNRRITRRDRTRRLPQLKNSQPDNSNWGLPQESASKEKGVMTPSVRVVIIRWLCGDTIAVLPRHTSLSHRVLLVIAGWQFRPGFHWYYLFLLVYYFVFGATIGALWWTPDTQSCEKGTWALLAFVLVDIVVLLVTRPFRSYFDFAAALTFECFTAVVVLLSAAGQNDSAAIVSKVQTVLTVFAFIISAVPFYFRCYHKRQPVDNDDGDNMFVELGLPFDTNRSAVHETVVSHRPKSKPRLKAQLHELLLSADPAESLRPYIFVEEWHALKMTSIAHAHACLGTRNPPTRDGECKTPLEAVDIIISILCRRVNQAPPSAAPNDGVG
jgi:hypothetical protein